jgi:hypothetical protein
LCGRNVWERTIQLTSPRFIHLFGGLLSVVLLALPGGVRAIDLTPRFSDNTIGGVVQRRMFFADGNQKIGVNLDFQTKVEAGAGGAVFRFQRIPAALFVLRSSPMSADEPFGGVSLQRYREAAHRLLPPNVTSVESLEEIPDPVTSNGWHSYRFVFSYVEQATSRICSVTFINLRPEEQIAMIVAAPANDFDSASQKSWLILRTWQVIPAEPTATPSQTVNTAPAGKSEGAVEK